MTTARKPLSSRPVGVAVPILDEVALEPMVLEAAPVIADVLPAPQPEVLDALPAIFRTKLPEPTPPSVELPDAIAVPAAPAPHKDELGVRVAWALFGIPEWLFGVTMLIFGLAILAAIPIVNFLSLGFMLESSARIARSGRIRDGFIGVRLAARVGGMIFFSWLCLIPVRIVADFAKSAQIIDPGGKAAAAWRVGLFILIVLTFIHIVSACALGGRLRNFLFPFNPILLLLRFVHGGYYPAARDGMWRNVMSLRLPYYFFMGFRGALIAFIWLALPISMIAFNRTHLKVAPFVAFGGCLMLMLILPYLPFLQLRMAVKNRFHEGLDLTMVRREYCRAPIAFLLAFFVTLLFALPLYLLKIQIVPNEATWLPSLFFVIFMFPARVLTGWAMGRAYRRDKRRNWFFRWTARLPFLPIAAFFVLIVYFTQYTSWNGVWSLYEQHAFLVPVPFFGM